jgi:hypothetical protein
MITVTLNAAEQEILNRGIEGQGGYQGLLEDLQAGVQPDGSITLNDTQLERIPRYAFEYGNGGWEDRLTGVFGRTLGPRLDGDA